MHIVLVPRGEISTCVNDLTEFMWYFSYEWFCKHVYSKTMQNIYNRDQLWSIELFWSWENQQVNWKTIRGWCYLGKCAMFTLFTVCWTILGPDGTGIQLNRATLWEPGRCPPKALFASTAKHHPPGALWPMPSMGWKGPLHKHCYGTATHCGLGPWWNAEGQVPFLQ